MPHESSQKEKEKMGTRGHEEGGVSHPDYLETSVKIRRKERVECGVSKITRSRGARTCDEGRCTRPLKTGITVGECRGSQWEEASGQSGRGIPAVDSESEQ